MTTGPDQLIAFVTARLDEDEQIARTAADHGTHTDMSDWEYAKNSWHVWSIRTVAKWGTPGYEDHAHITFDREGLSDSVDDTAGPHIARHDPAAILQRVAAGRELLAHLADHRATYAGQPSTFGQGVRHGLTVAVGYLASQWSDHPDYSEDFRP